MKLSRPLILLVLAAVLPLIVLSAALGVSALRQQQATMQGDAEARVELASVLIARELGRQVAVVSAVTQSPVFDNPSDQTAVSAYLTRLLRDQTDWRVIVLSDAEGRRIAYAPQSERVSQVATEIDSHRLTVSTARPVVGRLMRRPSGVMGFAVRAPVIRAGKVIYVVSAIIEPEVLRRLLLTQPLPTNWRGGVVDASGRIAVRINARQDVIGALATPETLRLRQRSSSGFVEARTLEGEPVINSFKVVPGWGWSVHAAIPLNAYRAPMVRSVWLLGAAGLACLLLAWTFMWLLSRELGLRQREGEVHEEARRMEALGRMTGGVAHDFNNLLMIVQGSAELLKRRVTDPDRVASLSDAILSAAQRGQTLTRQLLAFARRSAHEAVDFRLQDRAAQLVELIGRSLRDDIALTVSIPPDTWPLHADPDALEIALINLAVNARDAMPAGGVLTIAAANAPRRRERGAEAGLEGDYVAITVKDSGEGVSEEHIGHIFEPFYTTKAAGRGTGLGLSQVYGFARQSGGAVTVTSPPGEGASFTLYLPRASREPIVDAAASSPPTAANAAEHGRLLLVEDEPAVASAVGAMLENLGYDPVWAQSGGEALELIDGGADFDVVLSDVRMAGLSGIEFAAALRARRPHLPVVLMTGHAEGFAELTDQIVLMKPFGPDQALSALRRARMAASALVSSAATAQPKRA